MTTRHGGECSRGGPLSVLAGSLPVPGQELGELMAFGASRDNAFQHIGEISLRHDAGGHWVQACEQAALGHHGPY